MEAVSDDNHSRAADAAVRGYLQLRTSKKVKAETYDTRAPRAGRLFLRVIVTDQGWPRLTDGGGFPLRDRDDVFLPLSY